MSGGYFATSSCYVCGRLFTFDPDLVPSVPVDPHDWLPLDVDGYGKQKPVDPAALKRSVKLPICEHCIERVNGGRAERGLEPIAVLPGAYEWVEGLPP